MITHFVRILVKFPPYDDLIADIPENINCVFLSIKKSKSIDLHKELIKKLDNPLGIEKLSFLLHKKRSVLLLCDDFTRETPVKEILTILFIYLEKNDFYHLDISILVCGGSHRLMTETEIFERFGRLPPHVSLIQHEWFNPECFIQMGEDYDIGKIYVNKLVHESDFVIAIGNIIPHEIAGFSGGGKIILPGCSSEETVSHLHWISTKYPIDQRLGDYSNPIRKIIDRVAMQVGLDFIINTVLDSERNCVGVFCGDPIKAHEQGANLALDVYSIKSDIYDIIITDSVPEYSDLWTSVKAILHTKSFVRKNGIMIVCAACIEGVGKNHPQILEMGYHSPEVLEKRYLSLNTPKESKRFNRLTATHCANIWEILQHCEIYMVTRSLKKSECEFLGFKYFNSLQDAVDAALKSRQPINKIGIIARGSEIMRKR